MSRFLRNLINRHRPADAGVNAGHFVQPRPKSRFENPAGADSTMGMADLADNAMAMSDSETRSAGAYNSRPEHNASGKNNPAAGLYSSDLDTSIDHPLPDGRQDTDYQHNTEPARAGLNAEHSDNHLLTMPDAIGSRIQTARDHLNRVHAQPGGSPPFIEQPPGTRNTDAANEDDSELAGRSVEKPVMPGQSPDIVHADSLKKYKTGNQPGQQETSQSGVMQTPHWLDDRWSGFTNRFQEIKNPSAPEPEVNVNIGRVVIKAIQTEPVKPAKDPDKPGGIMSLDDYLKQRDARWS